MYVCDGCSINQSINQSISRSTNQSANQLTNASASKVLLAAAAAARLSSSLSRPFSNEMRGAAALRRPMHGLNIQPPKEMHAGRRIPRLTARKAAIDLDSAATPRQPVSNRRRPKQAHAPQHTPAAAVRPFGRLLAASAPAMRAMRIGGRGALGHACGGGLTGHSRIHTKQGPPGAGASLSKQRVEDARGVL